MPSANKLNKAKQANDPSSDLKSRASKVNALLKEFASAAGSASEILQSLSGISADLDKELKNFITALENLEDCEDGVASLRQLKALNGLNCRIAVGLSSNINRLKDTQSNSVIVS